MVIICKYHVIANPKDHVVQRWKKLNLQNAFETQDRTLQLPYRYHSLLLYNIKIDIK